MNLFDAHCHLQDERFRPILDRVLARADAVGVCRLMCCGSCEADWEAVRAIAAQYRGVSASYGLHPWYVGSRGPEWGLRLRRLLEDDERAAVGEIGLDHAVRERCDAEQEDVFVEQVRLARELDRPVTIHCRRAWGRLPDLLKEAAPLPRGFMVHSYSGAPELIPPLAALGAFFSFSGSITRPANRRGRQALCAAPLDRLLLETDAPDIAPSAPDEAFTFGAGLNHPANLVCVLETAAALRGISVEALAETTFENTRRFFGRGEGSEKG